MLTRCFTVYWFISVNVYFTILCTFSFSDRCLCLFHYFSPFVTMVLIFTQERMNVFYDSRSGRPFKYLFSKDIPRILLYFVFHCCYFCSHNILLYCAQLFLSQFLPSWLLCVVLLTTIFGILFLLLVVALVFLYFFTLFYCFYFLQIFLYFLLLLS